MYQLNPLTEAKNLYSAIQGRKAAKLIAKSRKINKMRLNNNRAGLDDVYKQAASFDILSGRNYARNKKYTDLDIKDMKRFNMSKKLRDKRISKFDPDSNIKVSDIFR